MRERIEKVLADWGVPAGEGRIEKLLRYREALESWNRKVGLVARGEDVTDHIIDSLRGLPVMEGLPGTLIADAGSGGGFPGVPLAVFQPHRRFVLVERSTKKAGFLRYAAAVTGIENIEIKNRGLEELDPVYEGVVFRALGELKRYIGVLLDITSPGGWLLGYKGRYVTAEAETGALDLQGARSSLVPAPPLFSPRTEEKERTFLIIRKD